VLLAHCDRRRSYPLPRDRSKRGPYPKCL